MEHKPLELRMYFLTVSSLKGISQGIMCGHAALEYAYEFGQTEEFLDFVKNHKTWIILNGGTTNDTRDYEGLAQGSLNQLGDLLHENEIQFSFFHEPDLNDALTALCFICDERVFNRKDYPDFVDWILNFKIISNASKETLEKNPDFWLKLKLKNYLEIQEMFPEYYKEWVRFVGGLKNVFLRELLKDKKLA